MNCENCGKELYLNKCFLCMTKHIKPEKVYRIYKIIIQKTGHFYIGYTGQKGHKRFNQHRQRCFNKNDSYNNSNFYKKVKELGITNETWADEIKEEILYDNITVLERAKAIESIIIYEHDKDEFCLNEKV